MKFSKFFLVANLPTYNISISLLVFFSLNSETSTPVGMKDTLFSLIFKFFITSSLASDETVIIASALLQIYLLNK